MWPWSKKKKIYRCIYCLELIFQSGNSWGHDIRDYWFNCLDSLYLDCDKGRYYYGPWYQCGYFFQAEKDLKGYVYGAEE